MIQIDEEVLRDSNEISFQMENRDIITFTKRQKGIWLVKGNNILSCLVCERTSPYPLVTRYCPVCGTIMEGVLKE